MPQLYALQPPAQIYRNMTQRKKCSRRGSNYARDRMLQMELFRVSLCSPYQCFTSSAMAVIPGGSDLSNYLMYRLHTHECVYCTSWVWNLNLIWKNITGKQLAPWYLLLCPLLLITSISEPYRATDVDDKCCTVFATIQTTYLLSGYRMRPRVRVATQ